MAPEYVHTFYEGCVNHRIWQKFLEESNHMNAEHYTILQSIVMNVQPDDNIERFRKIIKDIDELRDGYGVRQLQIVSEFCDSLDN